MCPQEPAGAGGRDQHPAAGQVPGAGVPSWRPPEDELLHHVQPQARVRGPAEGPRQPLRAGLLRGPLGQ